MNNFSYEQYVSIISMIQSKLPIVDFNNVLEKFYLNNECLPNLKEFSSNDPLVKA